MAGEDNTTFGRVATQGMVTITAKAHDFPGLLKWQCYDGDGVLVERYSWLDSTGVIRIHTAPPSDQDADGDILGVQGS